MGPSSVLLLLTALLLYIRWEPCLRSVEQSGNNVRWTCVWIGVRWLMLCEIYIPTLRKVELHWRRLWRTWSVLLLLLRDLKCARSWVQEEMPCCSRSEVHFLYCEKISNFVNVNFLLCSPLHEFTFFFFFDTFWITYYYLVKMETCWCLPRSLSQVNLLAC